MEAVKKIIEEKKPETISDYFRIYREIENQKENRKIKAEKTIRIAILSSSTSPGIKEVLYVKCCSLGILPEFYVAPYNQYAQEILDKKSSLYKFKPDLTVVFIDTASLFGEVSFFPYRLSDKERKEITDEKYNELTALIEALSKNLSGTIVFHNFEVPVYSSLGILENKQRLGFFEMIRLLNTKLSGAFMDNSRIFIFDYDSFCSKYGKKRIFDSKMYYLGDIKLGFDFIPLLADEYLGFIKPLMSLTRKGLVLDLDNTLWGGLVGEDGFEGIRLGPTPEGRPFMEFQKHILGLFERGVILAINSHNNPDEALRVLRDHPYMVLREGHFASMQINWNDKISNMKVIADEINIGMDSLVFIDDDKPTREMVKKALPEVLAVDLPEDPSLYVEALISMNDFNTLQFTEEDKKRGRMYAGRRKRNEYKKVAADITQYLKGLETVVTIEKADPFSIPRISQLTQKTNQFNATTRRYLEEDIKKFATDDKFIVASIKVEDKFGDNGIAGTLIVEKEPDKWRIDTFLLSCRIIGRRIEEALLAYVLEEAARQTVHILLGEFIPTKKNIPARDFYKNNGFALLKNENEAEIWSYDIAKGYEYPDFIKVVKKI